MTLSSAFLFRRYHFQLVENVVGDSRLLLEEGIDDLGVELDFECLEGGKEEFEIFKFVLSLITFEEGHTCF